MIAGLSAVSIMLVSAAVAMAAYMKGHADGWQRAKYLYEPIAFKRERNLEILITRDDEDFKIYFRPMNDGRGKRME